MNFKKIINSLFKEVRNFILPIYTRVYSWNDLPKENLVGSWNVIYLQEKKDIEKLSKHILSATKIVYYASPNAIECGIKTSKFGWCLLTLHLDLNFTEFGIYRSGVRYDVNYAGTLRQCKELYDFLDRFVQKVCKEYKNDKNL